MSQKSDQTWSLPGVGDERVREHLRPTPSAEQVVRSAAAGFASDVRRIMASSEPGSETKTPKRSPSGERVKTR